MQNILIELVDKKWSREISGPQAGVQVGIMSISNDVQILAVVYTLVFNPYIYIF